MYYDIQDCMGFNNSGDYIGERAPESISIALKSLAATEWPAENVDSRYLHGILLAP